LIRIIHGGNTVLYVTMFAVCNKLTLLSQWLAYDDLGPQCCGLSYTRDKNVWNDTLSQYTQDFQ